MNALETSGLICAPFKTRGETSLGTYDTVIHHSKCLHLVGTDVKSFWTDVD